MVERVAEVGVPLSVTVRMLPDAAGAARVLLEFTADSGARRTEEARVEPGRTGLLSLTPATEGRVRIYVDMRSEIDRGWWSIDPRGPDGSIEGDQEYELEVRAPAS